MSALFGCSLAPLDGIACAEIVRQACGEMPAAPSDRVWLLAYCDDGVVWGWRDQASEAWHLSSSAFPEISPTIHTVSLQQLRLFGPQSEMLIWRVDGGFRGRLLTDLDDVPKDDPARPATEQRVLLGDRLFDGPHDGFSLVGDATGSRHAVPLICTEADFLRGRWPLRLDVRQYFEHDVESGAVRVAASRLVDVTKGARS